MALHRICAVVALGALAFGCTWAPAALPPPTLAAQPLPDAKIAHADYANPSVWLCRPGIADDKCKINLDSTVIAPDGTTTIERYKAAGNPSIRIRTDSL